MKKVFTIIALLATSATVAQWSNTSNFFTDSLHMAVCQETGAQKNSFVVKSYPDSGYIVVWEDYRNSNQADIYAQKYDKNGSRLWAANGVPVATGLNPQTYTFSYNGDYRNYSYAATDSAGGIYLTWMEMYRVGSYNRPGISLQHLRNDGTVAFAGGHVVAQPLITDAYNYYFAQLIPDGYDGFFLSFIKTQGYDDNIYVQGYNVQGGTLNQYSSELMNQNASQKSVVGICGFKRLYIEYWTPDVADYHIWPDGQGGCNVIMNMYASDGGENTPAQRILAYNAIKRVKKNSTTITYRRTNDIANVDVITTNYTQGDVLKLYNLQTFFHSYACTAGSYTNFQIENFGLGFHIISSGAYDQYYAKGITLPTNGNIKVNAVAISERQYINNQLTPFVTKVYTWPDEVYDSIPYQKTSYNYYYSAYNATPPSSMHRINFFRDTLLSTAYYYHDFALAGSGDKIYGAGKLWQQSSGIHEIYLQQLKLTRVTTDSFAIAYNTSSKKGVMIGKEVSTGFSGSNIGYDNPMIATDNSGNAVFYIREYYRYIRVSPIKNGSVLAWGAMGKPIGTGVHQNAYYRPELPFISLDATNGTGAVSWHDDRYPPNSGENIYMRHLDSVNVNGYIPLLKPVNSLGYGSTFGYPAILLGTTSQYSVVDAYNSNTGVVSPVIEILDNYNLGNIELNVYQHTGAVRLHNGTPYLNRNYTIKVQNNPAGAANINLRLYFTNAEFDALKAADPGIINPGSLAVVKQPNNTITVPSTYTPVAGEVVITPISWKAVSGGYYIEILVNSFSNFFIQKNNVALPVIWLGVQAAWEGTAKAKVSWQVAGQQNVKDYTVQYSNDGMLYKDACLVAATNKTTYDCVVPAYLNTANYFRIVQQDNDGKKTYSKVVKLITAPVHTSLVIFPNPVKTVLYIQSAKVIKQVQIFDGYGRQVFFKLSGKQNETINTTQLAGGIYHLVIKETSGTIHTKQLIIE